MTSRTNLHTSATVRLVAGSKRPAKERQREGWSIVLFVLFVVATFTSLNPLAERQTLSSYLDTGSGDVVRQLCYLALLAGAFVVARGQVLRNIPKPIIVLFAWFALTLLWSPVPDIAVRRLILTIVIAMTAFALTECMSLERMIRLLCQITAIMMILSLVAAVLLPVRAIHQLGDPESSVIGDLRGIFYHKNTLGGIAAISILLSIHAVRTRAFKDWQGWGMLGAACLCLYLSNSKTSLGLTLASAGMYFFWIKFKTGRHLVWLAPAVLLVVGSALSDDVARLINDPKALTGRGLIWQMTIGVFLDHPIGGLGYQSIFQTGDASAFAQLTNDRFLSTLSHAHNSYLEILASTGGVGLILLLWALVGGTFKAFPKLRLPRELEALLTSIAIFIFLQSLTESGLADRDRPVWVVLMLVIGSAHCRMRMMRRDMRKTSIDQVAVVPRWRIRNQSGYRPAR